MFDAKELARIERAIDAFCADDAKDAKALRAGVSAKDADKAAAILRKASIYHNRYADEYLLTQEVPYQEIETLVTGMAFELE